MSIIEKAVEKLERKATPVPDVPGRDELSTVPDSVADDVEEAYAQQVRGQVEADLYVDTDANERAETVEIPFSQLAAMGMLTPDRPRSRIAEEYRAIKRPLLMNIAGKGAAPVDNANLVMVTSALAGEGKTFSGPEEVRIAYDAGVVEEHARIKVRMNGEFVDTTAGRVLLHEILPEGISFSMINKVMTKKETGKLIEFCYKRLGRKATVIFLDNIFSLVSSSTLFFEVIQRNCSD